MKNAVGAEGARLLRKVAKHILEEPNRYDQNDVISYGKPGEAYKNWNRPLEESKSKFPACGTVACIGGWLNILTSKRRPHVLAGLPLRKLTTLLGVTESQIRRLIAYTYAKDDAPWPERFRKAYDSAKTPRQRANVAHQRIEHFIKTGE
jgi:hypothetical protein